MSTSKIISFLVLTAICLTGCGIQKTTEPTFQLIPTKVPIPSSTTINTPSPTNTIETIKTTNSITKSLPTKTATPTSTPHPIVTIEPYSNTFPVDWRLASISEEQINEVKECNVEKLSKSRYPEQYNTDELIYLLTPQSSCDWSVLAFAYIERTSENEKIPENAKNAFAKAISKNPGFIFSNPLFFSFFDSFPVVKQPPLSEEDIMKVKIDYKWEGIGDSVRYVVDIRQADTSPVVELSSSVPVTLSQNSKSMVDKELVQSLGKSLSNLVPIKNQFSLTPCYDNNPDWTVTLTRKDGSLLILKTNKSNMIYNGGPWQVNIDGQNFLQFSNEFPEALDKLIQAIGLPYGETLAMSCFPFGVLEQAYP